MPDWERKPGFDLAGRRALVVGCGNPAGRAIALALAEAGADVAVASATLEGEEVMEAKRVAREVSKLGRQTMSQGWDVTLPTNVQVGLRQVVKEFGAPSILVYNADLALAKPIEKTTDSEFAKVQAVNLHGAFYAARSFLREREAGAPGRIVYVSSIVGERGLANMAAYASAKAGVVGLVHALSQEVGGRGVTVNCIAVGWMDWTPGRGSADPAENLLLRFIPMRRFGEGQELGPLAVLLASEAAGYINGQVLHVDGGVTTHL
jgi:3-oxoacyl-[acyl-carrier protein] reductase